MRMTFTDNVVIQVHRSRLFHEKVYLTCLGAHLTPAEARHVAAALVEEAEKAEKKGRKK